MTRPVAATASPSRLPVDDYLAQIRASLADHTRLVLEAPPGTGKTTRVPPALLEEPWVRGRRVLLLEPRRVAARSAARYIAAERGCELGEEIGFITRDQQQRSARTRLLVVTEGVLTRMLLADPALDGVAAVVFDEFHERHLQADLGLAFALDAQRHLRPDLRLLVMSATLDSARLAEHLDARLIQVEHSRHPLTLSHQAPARGEELPMQIVRALQKLPQVSGDVLVFLPGRREIEAARVAVSAAGWPVDLLYGELPAAEQDRVLRGHAPGQRRVILATNLAESSLTVPGVRAVIDSGLARIAYFEPNTGLGELRTERIARDSADQRAGRAAREGPGHCIRLWPGEHNLRPVSVAEIQRVDLARTALELAAWGTSLADLPLVDAPPAGLYAQAIELLQRLGAIDWQGGLSAVGRRLLRLPLHPRLAAMIDGASESERAMACDLAAVLEGADLLARTAAAGEPSISARLALLNPAHRTRSVEPGLAQRLREAARLRRQIGVDERVLAAGDAGLLLALAYPDRIAQHHGGGRYLLANGRGAQLPTDSALRGSDWLVVVELQLDQRDGLIRRAEALAIEALLERRPDLLQQRLEPSIDPELGRVSALKVRAIGQIVLDRRPAPPPTVEDRISAQLSHLAAREFPAHWFDLALERWLARVATLRAWRPELGLPDTSRSGLKASMADWLAPLLAQQPRFDLLGPGEVRPALQTLLDHAQQRALDRYAPETLQVPSGRRLRIDYHPDRPPVVEVKLQEMFGQVASPTVNDGRNTVLLHLLSPAGRPIQVTSDLAGFWSRTYSEVRKELKGRYPRHPWPDDPLTATATHRAKPRGT